jgi:hypothetical protein
MKKSIYKITTAALALVLFLASCDKISDFGDTNTNPAVTNTPNTAALLTNVLSGFGTYVTATYAPSLYCQYFSETQYPEVSNYSLNQASPMATYSGHLEDLQNIIKTNTDAATKDVAILNGANENQIAIARILKAYIFWTITDRWGDVPYKTALLGNSVVSYETQQSIYVDLIKELTEAVAQFNAAGAPIKGDVVYSGDIAKWKKFANSVRMLAALRLSKKYPGATEYAATQFKAALADAAGSISTNADNFTLAYPGGNFKNPFFVMYDGRKDYGESETMTTLLASLSNDARLTVFGADVNGAISTVGVPYGLGRLLAIPWTDAHVNWAYLFNPTLRAATSPLCIVTASSVLLARAEAADRGWTTETANTETLYQNGITASYAQWGLTAPTAAYFSNAAIDLTAAFGTGLNLALIQTQQYVAFFPIGVQGWSNWRRTGIPALVPGPGATNSPKVIPRRIVYGTTDYSLAKDSVTASVVRQFGDADKDKMDQKVWWDK